MRNKIHRKRKDQGLILISVVMATVFVSFSSCAGQHNSLLGKDFEDRLRSIEVMTLEDQSVSLPITVEEAEDEASKRLRKRQTLSERIDLSVEDVRKAALENNLDLKVELVMPSIAEESIGEEEAAFETTFFGASSIQKSDPPALSPAFSEEGVLSGIQVGAGIQSTVASNEIGVRIPLKTGGLGTVSLPVRSLDIGSGLPTQHDSGMQFSISQPLLRNAGVAVNTTPITIAKLQRRQTDSRTTLSAIRILATAEKAYWNHYAVGQELEVRHQQYERAVEQLKRARRLVEEGATAMVEVTRAEAGLSRRVDAIIVTETQRRLTERNLKRIMNVEELDLGSQTVLVAKNDPRPLHLQLDATDLAKKAVENRMEMLELELQLAIDAVTINVAENRILPLFSLNYTYSSLGRGTKLGKSFDTIFNRGFEDWRAGVVFEVPLGNLAARSRLRRAILQRTLSLSTKAQRALSIQQEVYDAVDQLERDWQRILAAREETVLAARIFEAERRLFQAGARTTTEVLEAEDFLADAQINEIRSLAAYETSKIDIAFATGMLLGYSRVQLTMSKP